jgi:2-polyprenyl-6-methoxyphenol hydroxylase-like FAD-dependent oxidoreductase
LVNFSTQGSSRIPTRRSISAPAQPLCGKTRTGVEVDVTVPGGGQDTVVGAFIVGADGIGSVVRKAMGVNFDGMTIPEIFLTLSTTYDFREAMPDIANIAYLSDPDEWFVLIRTARTLARVVSR